MRADRQEIREHKAMNSATTRPVALITGVGRTVGIGAAIATRLCRDGWDVGTTGWAPYDDRMPWGRDQNALDSAGGRACTPIERAIHAEGARTVTTPADLEDVTAAAQIFDDTEAALGPVTALVLCHCESVARRCSIRRCRASIDT